ncbi:MAG: hypothetical protein EXQ82_00470 [Pseudolabrys sp.]|nr:hypothetical protein [Pseudolabrys sp.]
MEKLESNYVKDRVFIVGGDVADCKCKLERLTRSGELQGREPVLIATGIFGPPDPDKEEAP